MEFFNNSKAGPLCLVPTIWLPDHLKAGPKKCPRDGHLNAGSSGFRMYTVLDISIWLDIRRTTLCCIKTLRYFLFYAKLHVCLVGNWWKKSHFCQFLFTKRIFFATSVQGDKVGDKQDWLRQVIRTVHSG
jgi:hypothetical protein